MDAGVPGQMDAQICGTENWEFQTKPKKGGQNEHILNLSSSVLRGSINQEALLSPGNQAGRLLIPKQRPLQAKGSIQILTQTRGSDRKKGAILWKKALLL